MKNLKIILIVAVIGVVGYAVYYFFFKRKAADNSKEPTAPPPTATPPINITGLSDPNQGAGGAAIARRIDELMKSNVKTGIQDDVRAQVNILTGVSDAKRAYYDQNISREPITSARNVPFALNELQKSALKAFTTIDTSGGGANVADNLLGANRQLLAAMDTTFIGNPELQNRTEFMKQVYCQGYVNCGKKYHNLGSHPNMLLGGQKAGADMSLMANTWLSGAELFEANMRERAISDLRAQGWKFTGFDF